MVTSITNDGKTPDWNSGYTEQRKHRAENNNAAFNPPLPESMLTELARKPDEKVKNWLRLCDSLVELSYLNLTIAAVQVIRIKIINYLC